MQLFLWSQANCVISIWINSVLKRKKMEGWYFSNALHQYGPLPIQPQRLWSQQRKRAINFLSINMWFENNLHVNSYKGDAQATPPCDNETYWGFGEMSWISEIKIFSSGWNTHHKCIRNISDTNNPEVLRWKLPNEQKVETLFFKSFHSLICQE